VPALCATPAANQRRGNGVRGPRPANRYRSRYVWSVTSQAGRVTEEASMCFAHSGAPSDALHVQAGVGVDAAEAFTALAEADGLGSVEVTGSGTPDAVVAPRGERVLDGFSRVMHNRWNRDLQPAVTVRPGEEIQLRCRDALDIGDQARTLTADGSMTLDLGRIHPLTGPVHVEGAEPGDILEVEILDVSPIVDFGYTTVSPALGMFGSLRPEPLATFASWTEPSQLSDPSAGTVPTAIPADQPHNGGAAFVQLFHFERGQNTGFATFVGADTGCRARIPLRPFMGILGNAPLRKGMFRTFAPNVSGGMGGNTDIRQLVAGSRLQLPVYVPGAGFSAGDGHMAQGDGEISGTGLETLMSATLRFGIIKDTVITGPRAIGGRPDPARHVVGHARPGLLHHHRGRSGPDGERQERRARDDRLARRGPADQPARGVRPVQRRG